MRLSDAVIDEINNIRGFKTTSGELILEYKAELITKIVNRLLHEVTTDPDTVSRKAAMDAVCEELDSIDHVPQWVFDRLTKKIENLPPSPSRPHGQWIPSICHSDGEHHEWCGYHCSECGEKTRLRHNFCPHCGADMRGIEYE